MLGLPYMCKHAQYKSFSQNCFRGPAVFDSCCIGPATAACAINNICIAGNRGLQAAAGPDAPSATETDT